MDDDLWFLRLIYHLIIPSFSLKAMVGAMITIALLCRIRDLEADLSLYLTTLTSSDVVYLVLTLQVCFMVDVESYLSIDEELWSSRGFHFECYRRLVLPFMVRVASAYSGLVIALLTHHRWRSVCNITNIADKSKDRHLRLKLFLTAILSLVIHLPFLLHHEVVDCDDNPKDELRCWKLRPRALASSPWFVVARVVNLAIAHLVPALWSILVNANIHRRLTNLRVQRASNSSLVSSSSSSERHASHLVLVLALSHLTLVTPITTSYVIGLFEWNQVVLIPSTPLISALIHFLHVLSHCINFLLYVIVNARIREGAKDIITVSIIKPLRHICI